MQGIMTQTSAQLSELLGPQFVQIAFALAILVVGWLVALLARVVVRGALKRTTIDDRLASLILDEKTAKGIEVERWVAKAVYYVILLFAVVGFFNALNLTVISQPLTAFLNQVFGYIPKIIGAGILVLAAWLLASLLRRIVRGALDLAKIDERLEGRTGLKKEQRAPLSKTLSDAVYWLVFLLFLPAILSALSLEGLLAPVQGLVDRILNFLPNILAAGVILAVGWVIARVVQRIVTNLLAALGADSVGERVGLSKALGTGQLSGLLGLIVYILILIPVLISSLNALALEAITAPASEMLARFLDAIPLVFAAALLLTLAYVVGRLVSTLVTSLLGGAGFDNVLERIGLAKVGRSTQADRTPSAIVGYLILVGIMLFASIEAAGLLGFENLAALVSSFVVFAGQVIVGLVVFGVGLYLANLASRTVLASSSSQAAFLAVVARVSIIILAGAIALRQMGLANEIIELAFGLLLGSVVVAAALAFGLGGRDVAAKHIEGWLASMKKP
jgi:hypothetical protein